MFVQVVGSLTILAAFVLASRGLLNHRSVTYVTLNLVGSAVLAIDAFLGEQWGFLLLEGVWALVSAVSLVEVLRAFAARREVRSNSI